MGSKSKTSELRGNILGDAVTNNDHAKNESPLERPVADSFFRRGPANIDQSKLRHVPNPYRWPIIHLNVGHRFNGSPVMAGPLTDDPMTRARQIRALPMREDDIILTAFPKCGTHWMFEMIDMLLKGKAVLNKQSKMASMLELIDDLPSVEAIPSPRYFNSHLYLGQLPEEVLEKRVKLIHIYRNAKDTALSWYHHIAHLFKPGTETLSFDNFLKGYITDEYSTFGHQFDYERQYSAFETAHPDHPIIHVRYEDLKKDTVAVLLQVSKFLCKPASVEFCQEIAQACSFQNMKAAQRETPHINGDGMYRKGIVGDWKNGFTVAQNELFDSFIHRQEKKGGINYPLVLN